MLFNKFIKVKTESLGYGTLSSNLYLNKLLQEELSPFY